MVRDSFFQVDLLLLGVINKWKYLYMFKAIPILRSLSFGCEHTLSPYSHIAFASMFNIVSMGLEPFFAFAFCMCEHLSLLPKIP